MHLDALADTEGLSHATAEDGHIAQFTASDVTALRLSKANWSNSGHNREWLEDGHLSPLRKTPALLSSINSRTVSFFWKWTVLKS